MELRKSTLFSTFLAIAVCIAFACGSEEEADVEYPADYNKDTGISGAGASTATAPPTPTPTQGGGSGTPLTWTEVEPSVQRGCFAPSGGGTCHDNGQPPALDSQAGFDAQKARVIARIQDAGNPMPPAGSGVTLSDDDKNKLLTYSGQ